MRISFKCDYALKTIFDLALAYKMGIVRIGDIAKRQDIPLKYLEQILLILKGAKYVSSKLGPKGGYFLAKPPEKITLGEIIRLFEGYTSPITCISKSCYSKCNDESKCPFRDVWIEIRNSINNAVDKTTFEDICRKNEKIQKQKTLNYEI